MGNHEGSASSARSPSPRGPTSRPRTTWRSASGRPTGPTRSAYRTSAAGSGLRHPCEPHRSAPRPPPSEASASSNPWPTHSRHTGYPTHWPVRAGGGGNQGNSLRRCESIHPSSVPAQSTRCLSPAPRPKSTFLPGGSCSGTTPGHTAPPGRGGPSQRGVRSSTWTMLGYLWEPWQDKPGPHRVGDVCSAWRGPGLRGGVPGDLGGPAPF